VRHLRHYTRIAQEHLETWAALNVQFTAGNYVEFLAQTALVQEIADFFLVASTMEHDDPNTSNAILMFSHLGECNEWFLNMDLARRSQEFAHKIYATVPVGGANESNRMVVMGNLANTYRRIGLPQQAIKLYMKCIQTRPEPARTSGYYGQMARCTMDGGFFVSALEWVRKAERILADIQPGGIEDSDKREQTNLHMDIKVQCHIGLRRYDRAVLLCMARVVQCNYDGENVSIAFVRAHVMLVTAITQCPSQRLERCESFLRLALRMCTPAIAKDDDLQRDTAKIQSLRCDVLLHLSFVLFKLDKVQEALSVLRDMLQEYLVHESCVCGFCKQNKNNKLTRMLQCGRCRVVRFCDVHHQKMASDRLATQTGKMVVPHRKLCPLLRDYRRKSISLPCRTEADSEEAQLNFLRTAFPGAAP
jgi:tetratricopeptide (TPR) repeat protein